MGRRLTILFAFVIACPAALASGFDGDRAFAAGDYAGALREWSTLAAAGDPSAMSAVGMLYDTGHGVPQDFRQALAWYKRAAEAGDVAAMFSTAAMYDNGRGIPENRREAIRWYTMAADQGNGRAAYDLGVIYRDGDGVPPDKAAAVRYFRVAASAGLAAATSNLERLGAAGAAPPAAVESPPRSSPRPPTDEQTVEIARFQQAALSRSEPAPLSPSTASALVPALEQGVLAANGLAEYDLGYAYEHGVGIPADLVQAYVLYLKAAASHAEVAAVAGLKGAAAVGNRLTPEQHAAARRLLIDGL